jgi:hypothetical protein
MAVAPPGVDYYLATSRRCAGKTGRRQGASMITVHDRLAGSTRQKLLAATSSLRWRATPASSLPSPSAASRRPGGGSWTPVIVADRE